jgi:outer membrane protein assembly factor BamA
MVDAVKFKGNRAVLTSDLAPIIATERTGLWRRWFGWNTGALTCLDSAELRLDAVRIHEVYGDHGYPAAIVKSSVTRKGKNRAQVLFTIEEGTPIIIDTVRYSGIPPRVDVSRFEARLLHGPFDDSLYTILADSIQLQIRLAGYARALRWIDSSKSDTTKRRGTVAITFRPGNRNYFGKIDVAITPSGKKPALSDATIARTLRIRTGARYNPRLVSESQRDLYELELYKSVRIDTAPRNPLDTGRVSDTIPVTVNLTEGDRRRFRASGGWGTLDCFRTQERFVEQNLFASGHKLELNGRLSKIGIGSPFSGLSSLCAPRVRADQFSQRLNYYVGATLSLRGIVGSEYKPQFTLFSERRSEFLAYEQSTDIGVIASVSRNFGQRLSATAQYSYIDGKTIADRAVSCTRFGFCRVQDLTSFLVPSPIHSIGVAIAKNPLTPTSDPVSGYRWQAETKFGHTEVGRTTPLNFTKLLAEGALYRPLGKLLVVAVRAQAGYVAAGKEVSSLLPPQERFYGGGQNSVRGFGQNLLGPGSYIVSKIDTVKQADGTLTGEARPSNGYDHIAPSGGNAMWLANLELRTVRGWPGGLLRYVMFIDAGRVWNTNDVFSVTNSASRITPGVGIRLLTPLGPFRIDIGYNPYGFEAGPAFFIVNAVPSAGIVGRAICVSPGATESLSNNVSQTFCPTTFTPTTRGSLLSRLAFHFSIGNAF